MQQNPKDKDQKQQSRNPQQGGPQHRQHGEQ